MEQFIKNSIVNAHVESFGIFHQTLSVVFRNDVKDYTLSLSDVEVISNIKNFNSFNVEARVFLIFLKLNLKKISSFELKENNTLRLYFDEYWVEFRPGSEYETWKLGCNLNDKLELLIANSDGTYSIWE